MVSRVALVAGLILAVCSPTSAQLPKSDRLTGDEPLQWKVDDILKGMPKHALAGSTGIDVPQWCKDKADSIDRDNNGHRCDGGIEARSLKFDDCGQEWTVCRCNDTPGPQSWDVIAEQLGKIPPGARSYVGGFMFTNGNGCDAISSSEGFIRVHGDCSFSQYLMVHEVGHSFDFNIVNGGTYYNWQNWLDAISADSCVTDNYANNNVIENFGQMFSLVTASYFAGHVPVDPSCLQRQFDTIWNDWRFQEAMSSPNCLNFRPEVHFANSAKFGKPSKPSDTLLNNFAPPPRHVHGTNDNHNHTHSATRPSAEFTTAQGVRPQQQWPLPPRPMAPSGGKKPAFSLSGAS